MRSATFEEEEDSDDRSTYVDPTPFLDPVYPESVWQEECSDFTLKMFGQVMCKAFLIFIHIVIANTLGLIPRLLLFERSIGNTAASDLLTLI